MKRVVLGIYLAAWLLAHESGKCEATEPASAFAGETLQHSDDHSAKRRVGIAKCIYAADLEPIWRQHLERLARRRAIARYGPLLRAYDLPEPSIEEIEALLSERDLECKIIVDHFAVDGIGPLSKEAVAIVSSVKSKTRSEIGFRAGPDIVQVIDEWTPSEIASGVRFEGRGYEDAAILRSIGIVLDERKLIRAAVTEDQVYNSRYNPSAKEDAIHSKDPITGLSQLDDLVLQRLQPLLGDAAIDLLRKSWSEDGLAEVWYERFKLSFVRGGEKVPQSESESRSP